MDSSNWLAFRDPRFELHFSYPSTVAGHTVEHAEETTEQQITIRLTSNDRKDVYFEVTKFVSADAQERYQALRAHSQHATEFFAVGELAETELGGQPALTFSFQRSALRRTVFLVQRAQDCYRITYNPEHPLNQRISETVAFP
jgi:hypothetical protein